jgi:hypothetical protein
VTEHPKGAISVAGGSILLGDKARELRWRRMASRPDGSIHRPSIVDLHIVLGP